MNYENWKGWGVFNKLGVPAGGGVRILYRDYRHQDRWLPACIFPTLHEDWLYTPSNMQDWDFGTCWAGIARADNIRDDKVFWNYFVNFNGCPQRPVQVKVTVYASAGKVVEERELTVKPDFGKTVLIREDAWSGAPITRLERTRQHFYVAEWSDQKNATSGWVSDINWEQIRFLTIHGREPVKPLYCAPKLSGDYEVYILTCQESEVEFDLELPGNALPVRVYFNAQTIPAQKRWRELFIGHCRLTPGDRIGIHQTPATVQNPLRKFGALYYLKLAPAPAPVTRPVSNPPEIVFYSEPYSLAYYYELQNETQAERLIDRYVELGVDKIVCQMGRVGMGAIYPSKVAVINAARPVSIGDDRQKSTGVADMMVNMNIMEVLPRLCRKRGIRFLANIGTNAYQLYGALDSKFAVENRDLIHPTVYGTLDYDKKEVVEHAVDWLVELAGYDVDGISIDHNRHPFGQTEQNILDIHRRLVEKLGARRKNMEINIRFLVDNPDYYRALLILLEENLVDSIIPSGMYCIYPEMKLGEYVRLARKYKKKIYGCVDFMGLRYTEQQRNVTPAEMRRLCATYTQAGTDGIFFYQSEMILFLLGQQRVVKALKQEIVPEK